MSRRRPILTVVLVALTLIGIVHFSRTFEAGPSLQSVQRLANGAGHADHAVPHDSINEKPTLPFTKDEEIKDEIETKETKVSKESKSKESKSKESKFKESKVEEPEEGVKEVSTKDLTLGKPIMAKMPNQTIRAEVGRAGWKMLHTILSQYPEEPTEDDKDTLKTYLQLFSRVYPCQECATHFQALLKKLPPQLGSRKNAVMWGCTAHNAVNERLGKPEYSCEYIFEEYDCGCGDEKDAKSGVAKSSVSATSSKATGTNAAKAEATKEATATDAKASKAKAGKAKAGKAKASQAKKDTKEEIAKTESVEIDKGG